MKIEIVNKLISKIQFELTVRFKFFRKKKDIEKDITSYMSQDQSKSFHGDKHLKEVLSYLFKQKITSFVETGTFLGRSTLYVRENYAGPIYSFEKKRKLYELAQKNLGGRDVTLVYGDSGSELPKYFEKFGGYPLFYLDAHYKWAEDSPLSRELKSITENFDKAVIIVDDFKVPGDNNFQYDVIFDFSNNPLGYRRENLDFNFIHQYIKKDKQYTFFVPFYMVDDSKEKNNGYLIILIGVQDDVVFFLNSQNFLRRI